MRQSWRRPRTRRAPLSPLLSPYDRHVLRLLTTFRVPEEVQASGVDELLVEDYSGDTALPHLPRSVAGVVCFVSCVESWPSANERYVLTTVTCFSNPKGIEVSMHPAHSLQTGISKPPLHRHRSPQGSPHRTATPTQHCRLVQN